VLNGGLFWLVTFPVDAVQGCAPSFKFMDRLTLFGVFAVTAMLICYTFESHSDWFILGFALACALGSAYGFLQGAWPFGVVEAIWCLVAVRRWAKRAGIWMAK